MEHRALAVIGASHDISRRSRLESDLAIIADGLRYRKKGLMASSKFQRTWDAVPDENKFLMPLHGYLNSVGLLAMQAAAKDIKVCVVGSEAVCAYTELLRTYLGTQGIAPELIQLSREHTNPSLGKTVRAGSQCLGSPRKYVFIAGDVPLVDLDKLVQDYEAFDPAASAVWLDFNAKERIFPERELFTRNYYHTFWEAEGKKGLLSSALDLASGKGRLYSYKEPNTFVFSSDFDRWDVIDALYEVRTEGRTSLLAIGKAMKHRGLSLDDARTAMTVPLLMADGMVRIMWKLGKKNVTTRGALQRFAALALGRQIHATISHNDPFRLKDIDAWHDLFFYREVFRGIEAGNHYESIFGSDVAGLMTGFNGYMDQQPAAVKESLPLVYDFEQYKTRRVYELHMDEYYGPDMGAVERIRPDEHPDEAIALLQQRRT